VADINANPQNSAIGQSAQVADWPSLRLFNQYRLLMLLALAAIYYLSGGQRALGERDPAMFQIVHLMYLACSMCFIYLIRERIASSQTQFYLQSYADIVFLSILMYASGGVSSGLGPLLLVNIALLSQITTARNAFLFAAIASLCVLAEELIAATRLGAHTADFQQTAMLGALLFVTAWLMAVPLRHLLSRQLSHPSTSRAALDVHQIATLNEEIIRELDAGVVVIDSHCQVQLINDTARVLLACEMSKLPMSLGRLCGPLLSSMRESLNSPTQGVRPFEIEASAQSVLPHYTPLSAGGMLIRLDDHRQIQHQYQQLKLVALGRLSASIAHEIRNPLGAISHAVQLIEESPTLDSKDAELLDIARKHTVRINQIVEDVLQLSNQRKLSSESLDISKLVEAFCDRFRTEYDYSDTTLIANVEPGSLATFDTGHLDQVLWNLCTNACLHNQRSPITITIIAYKMNGNSAVLEVIDNGKGISDMDREQLFEPFFSTHHSGSGLGLYIIRELCELNNSSIECLSSTEGAHFRITFGRSQAMAA